MKRTLFLYVGRADNLVPAIRRAARVLGTLDWGCAVKIVPVSLPEPSEERRSSHDGEDTR